MMPILRRAAVLLAALVACVLPVGSAQAAQTTQNVATAFSELDDGRVFDFAWQLSQQRGVDVVDHRNEATARGLGCLRCEATAVAFQIVLVSGRPSPRIVTPVNVADAQNVACVECITIAQAYQWVRVVPATVRFTEAGKAALAGVRDRLRALERQDLPPEQLVGAIATEARRVDAVLNTELVLKSDPQTQAEPLSERLFQDADVG